MIAVRSLFALGLFLVPSLSLEKCRPGGGNAAGEDPPPEGSPQTADFEIIQPALPDPDSGNGSSTGNAQADAGATGGPGISCELLRDGACQDGHVFEFESSELCIESTPAADGQDPYQSCAVSVEDQSDDCGDGPPGGLPAFSVGFSANLEGPQSVRRTAGTCGTETGTGSAPGRCHSPEPYKKCSAFGYCWCSGSP